MNMFSLFCPSRSQKYIQFHVKENKAHVTSDRLELECLLGTFLKNCLHDESVAEFLLVTLSMLRFHQYYEREKKTMIHFRNVNESIKS